jgi:hypothetical protein
VTTRAAEHKTKAEQATLEAIVERSGFCLDCGDRVFKPDDKKFLTDVPHEPTGRFMLKGDEVLCTPAMVVKPHEHKSYAAQRDDNNAAFWEAFAYPPGGERISAAEAMDRWRADPRRCKGVARPKPLTTLELIRRANLTDEPT